MPFLRNVRSCVYENALSLQASFVMIINLPLQQLIILHNMLLSEINGFLSVFQIHYLSRSRWRTPTYSAKQHLFMNDTARSPIDVYCCMQIHIMQPAEDCNEFIDSHAGVHNITVET
jgi:hypothetical protein